MLRFKRVLLINPPHVEQGGYTPSPLGILYLTSFLRKNLKNIKVQIVDGAIQGERSVKDKIKSFKPDLIGISVLTPGRHEALKVASLSKKINPRGQIVLGGVHPTIMWQQMMTNYRQIDFVVRGEGEKTLYELIKGKKLNKIDGLVWRNRKKIINNIDRKLIANIDNLPYPAWDLIDPTIYPPRGIGIINDIDLSKVVRYPIIFSRGCMGACTFCSSWKIWRGYRNRSGKNVALEIEMLYKKYQARHFVFQDDTLTGDREEIIKFCKEIIKRKIKIAIFGTTRVDKVDREILRWMRKAGFYELSFGIESGSPSMLIKINKRTDLEKINRAIFLTKKAGIKTCALMIYGLPRETEEDRILTQKLLQKIKPDEIGSLGEVWIFPGTALYEQAKNAKLINDNFWLSRKPYYIYRGGIGGDKINWKLKIKDEWAYLLNYFKNSIAAHRQKN